MLKGHSTRRNIGSVIFKSNFERILDSHSFITFLRRHKRMKMRNFSRKILEVANHPFHLILSLTIKLLDLSKKRRSTSKKLLLSSAFCKKSVHKISRSQSNANRQSENLHPMIRIPFNIKL